MKDEGGSGLDRLGGLDEFRIYLGIQWPELWDLG